jgi:hypothetical protein
MLALLLDIDRMSGKALVDDVRPGLANPENG